MKKLEPIVVDTALLASDLTDLEGFLTSNTGLKERDHVIPFFKQRPQLTAALGLLNGRIGRSDLYANELGLFGTFVCDCAAGDLQSKAFLLVEFEDAKPYTIFEAPKAGKPIRSWSTRFEHGFSQLVDWAWRLSPERETAAGRAIFGVNQPHLHFLLVAGRTSDLTADEADRLVWRTQNTKLAGWDFTCMTYDDVLGTLKRRLIYLNGLP